MKLDINYKEFVIVLKGMPDCQFNEFAISLVQSIQQQKNCKELMYLETTLECCRELDWSLDVYWPDVTVAEASKSLYNKDFVLSLLTSCSFKDFARDLQSARKKIPRWKRRSYEQEIIQLVKPWLEQILV
ncbi:MAG: hypothetical protein V1707_01075 [bacterium]